MRYFVCLLVAVMVFVQGAQAGSPVLRPRRDGAFVYHFDDPKSWGLGGAEISCAHGCLIPPASLFLRAYIYNDGTGTVLRSSAYRLVDEIPVAKTYRVSAWVNGDGATADMGLSIDLDDIYGFTSSDAAEYRSWPTLRARIYRRDIGPGWQRVQLGVIRPPGYVPFVRWFEISMILPEDFPETSWLVGQIEFSPAPELDDASPADLP